MYETADAFSVDEKVHTIGNAQGVLIRSDPAMEAVLTDAAQRRKFRQKIG